MQLAWYVHQVGTMRLTDGDRSVNLGSAPTRYIVPFLLEMAAAKPADARGVGDLWFAKAETLTRILSGEAPLAAAPRVSLFTQSEGVAEQVDMVPTAEPQPGPRRTSERPQVPDGSARHVHPQPSTADGRR